MSTFRLKGASGPVINRTFTLGERTLIGRADDCQVRLDPASLEGAAVEGVAPHHAEILQQDGGLTLVGLDRAKPTLLNGEPVSEAALTSGDEIRIANCRFVLQAPGLRPDKVLTGAAVRPRRGWLPWLIVGTLLAAAAAAWQVGWLAF